MLDTDDYPDTSKEDARDESARDALDNLESPDMESDLEQALESLESLGDSLQQVFAGLKEIR